MFNEKYSASLGWVIKNKRNENNLSKAEGVQAELDTWTGTGDASDGKTLTDSKCVK